MKFFLRCWRIKDKYVGLLRKRNLLANTKEKPSSVCSQVGMRKRTLYSE